MGKVVYTSKSTIERKRARCVSHICQARLSQSSIVCMARSQSIIKLTPQN